MSNNEKLQLLIAKVEALKQNLDLQSLMECMGFFTIIEAIKFVDETLSLLTANGAFTEELNTLLKPRKSITSGIQKVFLGA
jgi:hypothetical protein